MASTKLYSLSKDGNKKLSANFSVKEFKCNDGSDAIVICQETVDILQAVRDYFGRPVHINSAYRTPSYNKKVGGVSNSQHVKGTACDIRVEGIIPKVVAAFLEANYPKHGIGLYNTFVHVDSRGKQSRWVNYGKGNVTVTSFNLGDIYKQYKKKVTTDIPKKEDKMTGKEIYDALNAYTKTLKLPDWAKKEYQEAIDMGITDGSDPMSYIPRYQAAIMAKRAVKGKV